jgi:hypothetical protein
MDALFKVLVIVQKTLSFQLGPLCRSSSCCTEWYNEVTHILDFSHPFILNSKHVNSRRSPGILSPRQKRKFETLCSVHFIEHNHVLGPRGVSSIQLTLQIMLHKFFLFFGQKQDYRRKNNSPVYFTPVTSLCHRPLDFR